MRVASSASAVTALAVSPGCNCKFIANSMMRVAESGPNLTWTVVVKGSRWRVTDSNEMARVESG